MNTENILKAILLPFILLTLISCGAEIVDDSVISGSISMSDDYAALKRGPVFITVSETDDIELIENDPASHIAAIFEADLSKGNFSIDLKDTGIAPGDEVFLFAFADNDYTGGIPNPTTGDIVGLYIDSASLSTRYRVGSSVSPDIILNRFHYGHDTQVVGLINSDEAGDVILIAYAGDFSSTDFSAIDVDSIIGYKKISKPANPVTFTLRIMPYGFNTPVSGVYVIALLDKNRNGIPDDGDMICFASESSEATFPVAITIDEGITSCGTIEFRIPVYTEPDDGQPPLRITGSFTAPAGYEAGDKPVFIIAAKGSDPNEVFENIKNLNTEEFAFIKVDTGATEFDLNLPRNKFTAGDEIFLFALWDKDYTSGLPNSTEGDMLGMVQNKDNFSYTVTLQEFDNTLTPDGSGGYNFNGNGGYSFDIDRNYYSHDAALRVRLEKGALNDSEFANGARVILTAFYETESVGTGYTIEMDSIIASTSVTLQRDGDYSVYYRMPLMPAIYKDIPVETGEDISIDNVYIFAVLDSNGNGKPDEGEKIGFYWRRVGFIIYIYYPEKLPNPLGDGTTIPDKSIRFSDQTY